MRFFAIATLVFSISCTGQNFSSFLSGGTSNGKTSCSTTDLAAKVTRLNQSAQTFSTFGENRIFDERDFDPKGVKSGTEIIVSVDRDCVLQNLANPGFKDIFSKLKNTKSKYLTQQSLSWKLKRDYTVNELKTFAMASPCILALSPNKEITPQTIPNDEFYSRLSHLQTVKYESVFDKLFAKSVSEKDIVTVAIIDTGNDRKHPDLAGQHWENLKEKNGIPGVDDDGNGFIDDVNGWNFTTNSGDPAGSYQIPHGEHVAGLIGAVANNGIGVVGLGGSRVKLMHLNIFEMTVPGTGQENNALIYLEQALRYAADNGAQVINLSLGGGTTSTTQLAALKYALDKGVFIAAAAGNASMEVSETQPFIPAMYAKDLSGMIAVGASDSSPAFNGNTICVFSNFSPTYIEIAAPGCDSSQPQHGLLSTQRYNADTQNFPYTLMAGTSMATPLVSAAAAVVISYIKEKSGVAPSNNLVKKILKEGSLGVSDVSHKIDQGHSLDMSVLIAYIDKNILGIDCL